MNTEPNDVVRPGESGKTGCESTDLPVGSIALAIAALTGGLILILALTLGLYLFVSGQSASRLIELASGLTNVADQLHGTKVQERRSQLQPSKDLEQLLELQRRDLSGYSWVDRESQIVRIPIEQAMKLIIERGIPKWTNSPRGTTAATAGETSSNTTTRAGSVSFEEHLGASITLNLLWTDDSGREMELGSLFGRRPIILVLGYFRCPMLCDVVLNGLVQSLRETRWTVGQQFDVVVISIDPTDTVEMASEKKRRYTGLYGRAGVELGWHFLISDPTTIRILADEVGFRFSHDAGRNEFAHPSGFVVLTPSGRIARYFFGIDPPIAELSEALADASGHQIGSPAKRLWLLCFGSEFSSPYGKHILKAIRGGGVLTVALLIYGIASMIRRERQQGS